MHCEIKSRSSYNRINISYYCSLVWQGIGDRKGEYHSIAEDQTLTLFKHIIPDQLNLATLEIILEATHIRGPGSRAHDGHHEIHDVFIVRGDVHPQLAAQFGLDVVRVELQIRRDQSLGLPVMVTEFEDAELTGRHAHAVDIDAVGVLDVQQQIAPVGIEQRVRLSHVADINGGGTEPGQQRRIGHVDDLQVGSSGLGQVWILVLVWMGLRETLARHPRGEIVPATVKLPRLQAAEVHLVALEDHPQSGFPERVQLRARRHHCAGKDEQAAGSVESDETAICVRVDDKDVVDCFLQHEVRAVVGEADAVTPGMDG